MGTRFPTAHIKNHEQMDMEQFKKILYRYLKTKDLTTTTRENAQFSYYLTFSDDSYWVSLNSPEYEPDSESSKSDAQGLADLMKTCCIETRSVYRCLLLFYQQPLLT